MKACLLLAMVAAAAGLSPAYVSEHKQLLWASFKATYGKRYSGADEAHRFAVFTANMMKAAVLEEADPHATYGMNAFSDLTEEEFKVYHSLDLNNNKGKKTGSKAVIPSAAPTSIDWRPKGAVTHVKNQEQCGSCWAFSTTGDIEGQWFLSGRNLTSLSEQELVSCVTSNHGCGGGWQDNAFKWLSDHRRGQIVTETAYPYHSGDGITGRCRNLEGMAVGATISGHSDLPEDETKMAAWVGANGPLSINVDASSWQTYKSGIMTNCHGREIDHAVLIVGYGEETGTRLPYWIVKNSWGPSWGENGYIRLERGTNQCLLKNRATSSHVVPV